MRASQKVNMISEHSSLGQQIASLPKSPVAQDENVSSQCVCKPQKPSDVYVSLDKSVLTFSQNMPYHVRLTCLPTYLTVTPGGGGDADRVTVRRLPKPMTTV